MDITARCFGRVGLPLLRNPAPARLRVSCHGLRWKPVSGPPRPVSRHTAAVQKR